MTVLALKMKLFYEVLHVTQMAREPLCHFHNFMTLFRMNVAQRWTNLKLCRLSCRSAADRSTKPTAKQLGIHGPNRLSLLWMQVLRKLFVSSEDLKEVLETAVGAVATKEMLAEGVAR